MKAYLFNEMSNDNEDKFRTAQIFEAAAQIGAISALIACGQLSPYLKKSEAYRIYGRYRVDTWIDRGLINIRKDGTNSAAWRIDRLEIECISKGALLSKFL